MGLRRGLNVRLVVVVAVVVAAFAAFSAGLAGAQTTSTATWQLVDNHQSACFSPRVTSSYYGIWIKGRWRHSIDVGAQGLPTGGSYSTSYAPIAPGSSTGVYSLAYVRVQLVAATPVGTYTAALWASDGTSRQTVPITLVVKARCGY